MKFSTETDCNNWKFLVSVLFRFQLAFYFWALGLEPLNEENQERKGKRERRIKPMIKISKERSRTTDNQKRLRVKEKGRLVAEKELD